MASISKEPNGGRIVQFVAATGKRRSLRLGKVPQRIADAIRVKVEALNAAIISRTSWDGETAKWVAGIGDELAAKLAAVGLIPPRAAATVRLGEFLDAYIAGRVDVKPRTRLNLQVCAVRLAEFFGREKLLGEIKPGDADEWCSRLRAKYAGATAARTIKRAKQFFKAAVRKECLAANPFQECKAGQQSNSARSFFITREDARRVLDACPNAEWRLLFALSRFGGLRCPSETLTLTWADVDWARERIRVHSPKTEHLKDGGDRWIPLFPELKAPLAEAFELAEPGTVRVINRFRDSSQNLRTQLNRIIRRAGLTPWPRLWHNLRATRQTELAAEYPLHVVCAWIGNKAAVAAEHYLQVTDADFSRAAESGAVALQNPVQSPAGSNCQEMTAKGADKQKAPENRGLLQVLSTLCKSLQDKGIPPRGLEPLS